MTHPAAPHAYARAVLDRECADLAATLHGRNDRLNRAAFVCGRLVPGGHLCQDEVEGRLAAAAEASGYAHKDGSAAVLATVRSGVEAGMREPRDLGPGAAATSRPGSRPGRPAPALSGVDIPTWTEPGSDGRPRLAAAGQAEPPRFADEARRHVYVRDGVPVRVKIKRTDGSFTDWYRVRRSADSAVGWQARKPMGFVPLPYVPASRGTAFDPAWRDEDLVWAEGEKDADVLAEAGLNAFTFGSATDVPDMSGLLLGRDVIVAVDNDAAGRSSIQPKVDAALTAGALTVRLVEFADLPEGGDAADFFAKGGDARGFLDRARQVHPEAGPPVPEQPHGGRSCERQADDGDDEGGDLPDGGVHLITHGDVAEDLPDRARQAEPDAQQPVSGETHEDSFKEEQGDDGSGDVWASRPADDLSMLNERYCVVPDNGVVRVLTFDRQGQGEHARLVPVFMGFADFKNLYMNRFVKAGTRKMPLGEWWLKQPGRRQYEGLVFEPAAGPVVNNRLNLWRGWGVTPAPGDWTRMRHHIHDVLANHVVDHEQYILKWMAWTVQHPAEQAGAALVFQGTKGTGKGTLGNALCRLFGQHAAHISSASHLVGKFNGHLRDACLLFADEAYWPGDKAAEGALKHLVTEPTLFIEAKGKDAITVPNRLHVIMASNENWVVPASEDERRYAVFQVSDAHRQDEAWFGPLATEMRDGGYEAMLFDLLHMDIGDWHPRRIPMTAGLVQQQARNLNPEDAWWCELLETGALWGADPRQPGHAVSKAWTEEKQKFHGMHIEHHRGLYEQAVQVSPRLKQLNDHLLGQILSARGCTNDRKVMRRRGWMFPPLAEARAAWEARFPGWKWRDPAVTEWHIEE